MVCYLIDERLSNFPQKSKDITTKNTDLTYRWTGSFELNFT